MKSFKLALLSIVSIGLSQVSNAKSNAPKLVVGIVVDQMRWDYLHRFQDRFSNEGFKRIMNNGFNCENTYINYLPTFTAPGHASIYTGSVPALHGINGNDWIDQRTGRQWYCTEDTTVTGVGSDNKNGKMSPRNMIASTIADELKLATNFKAKTIGVSIKDRGSILPVGHSADAAYWYDDKTGKFISSTFYTNELPDWLERFNSRKVGDSLMAKNWETYYPIETYTHSTKDNTPYEGVYKLESEPVFPHQTSKAIAAKDNSWIRTTPYGNTITRMIAEEIIEQEQMGKDDVTDLLAVSFSSTDYIGHFYGINAIELEDTYIRMDLEIAQLLQFLDKNIGKDEYIVFISADHAAAHNPQFLLDHKIPAGMFLIKEMMEEANQYLQHKFGVAGIIKSLYNYQVHFAEEILQDSKLDRQAVKKEVISYFSQMDHLNYALDMEEATVNNRVVKEIEEMAINGYYKKRAGAIQLIFNPAWFSGYAKTGTTHGSWNPYDAHIPLLWYGKNVLKGQTYKRINVIDIAPTLAALLNIQAPNASIGKVIEEVIKK